MAFKMGEFIEQKDIPASTGGGRRSRMEPVYARLRANKGKVLPLVFEKDTMAYTARAALKRLADADGEFLSTNRGDDKRTLYAWLETDEVVAELRRTRPRKQG